jgi:hypothetical protein
MFGYNFREMLTTAEKTGKQIEIFIRMNNHFIKAILRTEDGVVRDTDNYLILRDYNREIVIPMASVVYMTVDERDYLSDKPRKNYISL